MNEELNREVGRHSAHIESMQKDMAELKSDVKAILAIANQAKGGWKTMLLMASVAGGVGALVGKFLPFWK